ncbi:PREDICTED: solute carrier organic anion transporter family member 2A1-like [Priapulus caudatus]|uniref:Solute carrier organic anion transporter family member 2A1-like n=1 Tax=Priapulus caudatus TaxID=37621 RepID=A0ABM1EEF0_PRICU|nr:PREDICTED: solute carrier organic anion transporter family member 2A1-like [Priapulus caudatus]
MFSKIYVDLSDTDLTPKDPQWIGAWWLGLLILSGVTFACALPFALFPNHLRSNATARDKSNEAVEHIDCDLQEHEKGEEIAEMIYYHPREFLRAMRRLLTNGLYVCVVLGVCFQFYSIIGYFAFLPKYLESYFGTTTAVSNSVVGMIGCVTPSIGLLLGGCFMRRRHLRPRGSFMLAFVSIFIYIALLIPMMLLPCDDLTHAGHFSDAGSYELSQDCNTDCGCNVEKYAPVCASNGVTYFSPCQAGCSDVYTLGDAKNFTGCSCTPDGVATAGKCDSACTGAMVAYFILLGVGGLLVAPANVASFSLKIR